MITSFEPAQLLASDTAKNFVANLTRNLMPFPVILPVGLEAKIDTSQCGFRTPPCYSARISGQRVKQFPPDSDDTTGAQEFSFTFLIDGLVQIVDPRPDSFTVQVLLIAQLLFPDMERTGATLFRSGRRKNNAAVVADANAMTNFAERLKGVDAAVRAQEIIDQLFSDWKLVWMGIEG
jgi:hypothetical protein